MTKTPEEISSGGSYSLTHQRSAAALRRAAGRP